MDITGVDFITVPTRDFDRASAFYADVLGLECSTRWGQMPAAEFETGTLTIAVMQSDAFGIEFQRHSHPIAQHRCVRVRPLGHRRCAERVALLHPGEVGWRLRLVGQHGADELLLVVAQERPVRTTLVAESALRDRSERLAARGASAVTGPNLQVVGQVAQRLE